MSRVPDFFVVGAQKAGTTTLHRWLSQSAEVALPWTKETHFFRDEDKFCNGMDWYMGQFKSLDAKRKVVGEIDPEYMYFPECAERIKSMVRAPKLIFILREPLSRAWSQYQMSVRRGYESLSFTDALLVEEERLNSGDRFSQIHHSYLDRSLYGKQLELMLARFDESEVLVLLFDELFLSQNSADLALIKVCDFIGINPKDVDVDINLRENTASSPRFIFIRNFIYKNYSIKKMFGHLVPSKDIKMRVMNFLDKMNSKPLDDRKKYNESVEFPSFALEVLIEDLRKVERLINVDISHWIGLYETKLKNINDSRKIPQLKHIDK